MKLRVGAFGVVVFSCVSFGTPRVALATEAGKAANKPSDPQMQPFAAHSHPARDARNVILFVGDGMGVSTVTATRIYSVGLEGTLTMDRFPYTAISRTYTADHFTPDSAGTISAMLTGVKANSGVLGFGRKTERGDFNHDGDGEPLWTLLELAKASGRRVGVVTTARITHATPAGTYAHINERDNEAEIALQALPGNGKYNARLGKGIDLMFGGGRRFFLPVTVKDEEGEPGARTDGLDLREQFKGAGYTYVHNQKGFDQLSARSLPVLGLFDSSHMEWEYDRARDLGKEPSLAEMTRKSIELLSAAQNEGKASGPGYFLLIEGGRIDHAHHAGNAFRAITDTEAFDKAIEQALTQVDLRKTLILVTADHSHVFTMAGYPVRPPQDLAYKVNVAPKGFKSDKGNILDVVYSLDPVTGRIDKARDMTQTPYTILGYQNGPGYRHSAGRRDPSKDPHPGIFNKKARGPQHPDYRQEAAVPLISETHGGEEVVLYAWGPFAHLVRGTVSNTKVFEIAARALGLFGRR